MIYKIYAWVISNHAPVHIRLYINQMYPGQPCLRCAKGNVAISRLVVGACTHTRPDGVVLVLIFRARILESVVRSSAKLKYSYSEGCTLTCTHINRNSTCSSTHAVVLVLQEC